MLNQHNVFAICTGSKITGLLSIHCHALLKLDKRQHKNPFFLYYYLPKCGIVIKLQLITCPLSLFNLPATPSAPILFFHWMQGKPSPDMFLAASSNTQHLYPTPFHMIAWHQYHPGHVWSCDLGPLPGYGILYSFELHEQFLPARGRAALLLAGLLGFWGRSTGTCCLGCLLGRFSFRFGFRLALWFGAWTTHNAILSGDGEPHGFLWICCAHQLGNKHTQGLASKGNKLCLFHFHIPLILQDGIANYNSTTMNIKDTCQVYSTPEHTLVGPGRFLWRGLMVSVWGWPFFALTSTTGTAWPSSSSSSSSASSLVRLKHMHPQCLMLHWLYEGYWLPWK